MNKRIQTKDPCIRRWPPSPLRRNQCRARSWWHKVFTATFSFFIFQYLSDPFSHRWKSESRDRHWSLKSMSQLFLASRFSGPTGERRKKAPNLGRRKKAAVEGGGGEKEEEGGKTDGTNEPGMNKNVPWLKKIFFCRIRWPRIPRHRNISWPVRVQLNWSPNYDPIDALQK